MCKSLLFIELLDEGSFRVGKIFVERATCRKVVPMSQRAKKKKQASTTQEQDTGGVSAIAETKKVFGVPHKELNSHVLMVKKPHVACEPHFAHP